MLLLNSFHLERVTGIEPVSADWQPAVIATILYPHFKAPFKEKSAFLYYELLSSFGFKAFIERLYLP